MTQTPPEDAAALGVEAPAPVAAVLTHERPHRPQGSRLTSRHPPLLRAVRTRQWLKNVLVAGVPLAAGAWDQRDVLVRTALAFVTFCLAASAVYLVNDVLDAEEDRRHPVKRHRPVASGDLRVRTALVAAAVLGAGALALAFAVRPAFGLLVCVYILTSLAYTLRLRREPVVELTVVALGFLLRGAAGGVAAGLPVSSWFLLVAGFGSLFLVAGKRFSELVADRPEAGRRVTLAAYSPDYLRFVWGSAATVTIAAYALWADQVYRVREDGAWGLWSLFPFVLAILRYALDIDRGRAEGPEEIVLSDRTLQLLGLVWVVMLAIGSGSVDALG